MLIVSYLHKIFQAAYYTRGVTDERKKYYSVSAAVAEKCYSDCCTVWLETFASIWNVLPQVLVASTPDTVILLLIKSLSTLFKTWVNLVSLMLTHAKIFKASNWLWFVVFV